MALTAGLATSRADIIQPTVELPAALGAYTFSSFCFAPLNRCSQNATVSGFTNLVHTQNSGNELVTLNATYSADIYTNNGGSPGTFLGTLIMPGFVDITFVGRNPSVNPLGTFTTILTDFDFQGMLGPNTFEVKQNPGQASTGSTTINQFTFTPPITYSVTSSIDIFALYSLNGVPFEPAPIRSGDLGAVPEPGSGSLGLAALIGLLALTQLKSLKGHRLGRQHS